VAPKARMRAGSLMLMICRWDVDTGLLVQRWLRVRAPGNLIRRAKCWRFKCLEMSLNFCERANVVECRNRYAQEPSLLDGRVSARFKES